MSQTSMAEPQAATAASRAERIVARCREVARLTDVAGETTRLFLSPATREVHALVGGWMRAAGMAVRTDAVGNLRGVFGSDTRNAPRLVIGSHLDTIPNAGAFDGILGVLMGVALVEELIARGIRLPFVIEVIGFSEEEGVRFAKPFLGSLAAVGELDPATLSVTDKDGTAVEQAIRNFGLNPAELPAAVFAQEALGYLEFHIEQGPVLEAEGRALAAVHAIVGQTRMQYAFRGQANHAGTTPMGNLRHDALAAAAQWVTQVERYAEGCSGLVATVGSLSVPGGASNVVPGAVAATLDVRHADDAVRSAAVERFHAFAVDAGASRGVTVDRTPVLDQAAVPMDPRLSELLSAAVAAADPAGRPARRMASGAGHDATIIARRLPAAMLFLRSPGGLSHHPDESVLPGDVEAAIQAGMNFLHLLAEDRELLTSDLLTRGPRGTHA